MKYLWIAIYAAAMLSTSALAAPWNGERGKGPGGYEGRVYQAYNFAGGDNPTYHRHGYAPARTGPGSRIVFQERCSFTNDPSC
jgi:hypothetical protein